MLGDEKPHGSLSINDERRNSPVAKNEIPATASSICERLLPRLDPILTWTVGILLCEGSDRYVAGLSYRYQRARATSISSKPSMMSPAWMSL